MKKFLINCLILAIILAILLFFATKALPQSVISRDRQIEVGFNVGIMNYLGDIQGNKGIGTNNLKDLNLANFKPVFGLFYVYYPNYYISRISLKLSLNRGTIHGADSLIKNQGGDEVDRIKRNLSFKTYINELILSAEIYLLRRKFRPFITTGLGVIYFIPTTYAEGKWVKLAPLQTEGIKYSTVNILIPIGGGFKYYTKNKIITTEILYRKSFTDYLDDVSTIYSSNYLSFREKEYREHIGWQRGDPKDNDSYFSIVIKCGFLLFQNVKFLRKQSLLCPKI